MRSVLNRLDQVVRPTHYKNLQAIQAEKDRQYKAELALQLEQFLSSEVGKYVQRRILNDKARALQEMASTKPTDVDAMTNAQIKYQVAVKIEHYLATILFAARNNSTQV